MRCSRGTYSAGGNATDPRPTYLACPLGTTTNTAALLTTESQCTRERQLGRGARWGGAARLHTHQCHCGVIAGRAFTTCLWVEDVCVYAGS